EEKEVNQIIKEIITKNKIMKNLNLLALLFFGISSGVLKAQESINTSGKTLSSVNGNISYTIGQIVYTTNSSSAGVISQGVQQPLE
ncbi:hypothetical protein, partial [Escherichia coli]|uniref:hypothetical protein n=1 Tax=Escherichia coli TaxID=562 RepID=UPI0030798A87